MIFVYLEYSSQPIIYGGVMYYVETTDEFDTWLLEQREEVQDKFIAHLLLLKQYGHQLSRPYADTLYGSKFSNMKELRVQVGGDPYRAFYAFDPSRQAIILCVGNKKGNDKQFYRQMIPIAEKLYEEYLTRLKKMV